MSTFVESLRRLHKSDPPRVTVEKLDKLLAGGKLTQEEYDYITT
jgi:hypothetical protein